MIQMGIDSTYRSFLRLVSSARNLPVERVHAIAQGRVWDGGTARQLGLVDQFGTLDDAINEAARRANLNRETAGVAYLEKEPGFWNQLLRGFADDDQQGSPDVFSRLAQRPESILQRALADAESVLSGPVIQARCLECPSTALPIRREQLSLMRRLMTALLGA